MAHTNYNSAGPPNNAYTAGKPGSLGQNAGGITLKIEWEFLVDVQRKSREDRAGRIFFLRPLQDGG